MTCRVQIVVAAAGVALAALVPAVDAQRPAPSTSAKSGWKVPRTPWGHPDLQGVYTNNGEAAMPLERPARFEGRRLEDITQAELDELRQERLDMYTERNANLGVDPGGFEGDPSQNSRAWMISDPPDGRIPPLTEEARKRPVVAVAGSFGTKPLNTIADFTLSERCITSGVPAMMMPTIYSGIWDITQSPTTVIIRAEILHDVRVIRLDGRGHVSPKIRMYIGDSIGWWDGDTLVVETTNFTDRPQFRGATQALKVTERFTPQSPEILAYSATLEDPQTWTRPWTFGFNFTRASDKQIFEYGCHESNYSMRNMLIAARAAEKARENDAK